MGVPRDHAGQRGRQADRQTNKQTDTKTGRKTMSPSLLAFYNNKTQHNYQTNTVHGFCLNACRPLPLRGLFYFCLFVPSSNSSMYLPVITYLRLFVLGWGGISVCSLCLSLCLFYLFRTGGRPQPQQTKTEPQKIEGVGLNAFSVLGFGGSGKRAKSEWHLGFRVQGSGFRV